MFTLGAIPSEHDERDFPLALLTPVQQVFPDTFTRRDFVSPIKNQGKIGSCVAHSLSYVCETFNYAEKNGFVPMSVGFIYGNRQGTVGSLLGGEGMRTRDALKNLNKFGDVPLEDFPINDTYPVVSQLITEDETTLLNKASLHKITAYAQLTTIEEVKTALMDVGVVTMMIPVYPSFMTVGSDGLVTLPLPTETLAGYHELTIIGWRADSRWIVPNSWGTDVWGDKGYGYIPFEYPVQEYWSVSDTLVPNPLHFIESIEDKAIEAYRIDEILPSITLAQACLESGYGTSAPGNMLFGIKWTEGCGHDKQLLWTWEYIDDKWVHVQAYFRKYASYEESILDHSELLNKALYKKVKEATDYKVACEELHNAGYATSPAYAQSLISIIEKFNLNKWDGRIYKMYNDAKDISPWAVPYVEKALELGIMVGDDKGNFNPKAPVTREEIAKIAVIASGK